MTLREARRGPKPIARTAEDLNSDVDVLQRRVGEATESAATVGDLSRAGIITQTSDGSYTANRNAIAGTQGLYEFLKDFN
jgi:hypothetical protein